MIQNPNADNFAVQILLRMNKKENIIMKYLAGFVSFLMAFSCSAAYLALDTVEEFDINKYMGKWYEIERLPNSFEEGLEEITASYRIGDMVMLLLQTKED